jgi:hypothetical protein
VIRFAGTVEYKDGRREAWAGGGAIQAEWEDYALRHDLPLNPTKETVTRFPAKRWQMYLAYTALEVEEGFDVWRKTVADVELDDEATAVPPTLAVATDG